jgi:hypothetical protein
MNPKLLHAMCLVKPAGEVNYVVSGQMLWRRPWFDRAQGFSGQKRPK